MNFYDLDTFISLFFLLKTVNFVRIKLVFLIQIKIYLIFSIFTQKIKNHKNDNFHVIIYFLLSSLILSFGVLIYREIKNKTERIFKRIRRIFLLTDL